MAEQEQGNDALVQLLLDQGILTEDQVTEVDDEHEKTGKPYRNILIDLQMVTEDQLLEVIATYLATKVINLPASDLPGDVIHSLPASVARMYNTVPVEAG